MKLRHRLVFFAFVFVLWQGTPARAQNILFYGNSFTNGLGSTDSVPNLVSAIATAAGQTTPFVHNGAVNGQSFTWHLTNNLDEISTSSLPVGQEWDYAVLQNFSTAPTHLGDVIQHRSDSVALYQAIANHSPKVTPVLFETWARGPGHSFYTGANPTFSGGPSQMQAEVRDGYRLAAQGLDAVAGTGTARLASVGDRWEDANWNNLHASDIYHANNRGTLLTSLVLYSSIYLDNTSDIDLSSVLNGLGLSAADGQFLTSIADRSAPPLASKEVVLKFDFGASSHPNPKYNVVTSANQNVANVTDFNTSLGSNISLSRSSVTGFNEAGANTSGTTSPGAPASDFFDGDATGKNLFGHDSNFNVGGPRASVDFTIDGLEQNRLYDFTFFASRLGVTDNRETQYDVVGLNSGTNRLDPAANTSEIARVLGIQPNISGEIVLTVQKGPNNSNPDGFFYLGGMEIAAAGVIETGDFDSDTDFDGSDFLSWQRGFGTSSNASLALGDGNGDGTVNAADLVIWKTQFGTSPSNFATSLVVPEPSSLVLLLLAILGLCPKQKAS